MEYFVRQLAMARIYLTARFSRQEEMRKHRETLQANGHEVTSQWLDEVLGSVSEAEAALIDLDDIDGSDFLLAFSETSDVGYYTGGRHVEFGYALGRSIDIVVVGPRENVFFHMPEVKQANTLEDALLLIA
jgi:hypothetical protein